MELGRGWRELASSIRRGQVIQSSLATLRENTMKNRSESRFRHWVIAALASCLLLLLASWTCAAENAAILMRVTNDVQYLSSDAMQGRGPGTQGLEEAADRIFEEFRSLGLVIGV